MVRSAWAIVIMLLLVPFTPVHAGGEGDIKKGDQYTAFVKYPTRKAMEQVTQIVVKKSD